MSDIRCRNVCGVIYPDDPNYPVYLSKILLYKHFCCLHDKDIDDNGELKKPHLHFLLRFDNPTSINSLSKSFDLPVNYFERCSDYRSYIRYLIHIDNPDKFQYPQSAIETNDFVTLHKCFACDDELQFVKLFLSWLEHLKLPDYKKLSYSYVLGWVLSNGFYDMYKKSYRILRDIILQYNGDLL